MPCCKNEAHLVAHACQAYNTGFAGSLKLWQQKSCEQEVSQVIRGKLHFISILGLFIVLKRHDACGADKDIDLVNRLIDFFGG